MRSHQLQPQRGLPPPTSLEAPLVGRSTAFAALVEAYHTCAQGAARAVLLEGEGGIGKTRLASAFLAWATAQGADLLQGSAVETSGRHPYYPVVDALRRRLARENAPDDLLGDVWLSELSRVLPELRDRYPDLPLPAQDEGASVRLFEAVAMVAQALAVHAPLVVLVDDLQWADVASRDLLHYALRRWSEEATPVLLLLTCRTEALEPRATLSTWLGDLARTVPVAQVTLNPLALEDVVELVCALATEEPTSAESARVMAFAHWLYAETAGHPLYILETLKALVEQGALTPRLRVGRGWGVDVAALGATAPLHGLLPRGVQAVIQARLARLAPGAVALLAAAAILERSSPFAWLCQVAGLDEEEGLEALDQALQSRLLREERANAEGGAAPTYALAHDKIRAVVYGDLNATRQRLLHGRAVGVLQRGEAVPAELAHHALQGGQHMAAIRYSVAAGAEALRVFAVRDAIAHYEQARQLHAAHGDTETFTAELEPLYLPLGRAYELASDLAQARRTYETLRTLARDREHPALESRALNRLATLAVHDALDVERAAALLGEVVRLAQRSGNRAGVAEAEWNLAQVAFYIWDADAVLRHGACALALAQELALPDLIARSLNVLGYGEMGRGRWADAEARFAEAQARYRTLGNRAMEADCLNQVAHVRFHQGRLQAGFASAHAARTMTTEIQNPWGQVTSAVVLTMGLLDSGALDMALDVASGGVRLARAHAMTPMLLYMLLRLGAVQRARGALEEARAAHLEAWALDEAVAPHPFRAMLAAELCADYVASAQWEVAYDHARQTLTARHYPLRYIDLLREPLTEALARAGAVTVAHEEVDRMGARKGDNARYRIPYLQARAAIARQDGDLDQACGYRAEALTLAAGIGLAI